MERTKQKKERGQSTYENKVIKLMRTYLSCPKIQAKYTKEQWLAQIKKPTSSRSD